MFQSKEYILKKHGKTGTDRPYYLKQLTNEYKTTDKQDAKQQVLANLANFAYDPINFNALWDLEVVDLFLSAITDQDPLLQEFGMGGLANICLEKRHYEYITSKSTFINNIINCINPENGTNLIINAMTTLMQLITEENYTDILTQELHQSLETVKGDQRTQISTMSRLFLLDYYHQAS